MFNVAIFGGGKIDGGMLEPGETVVSLSLFGGTELDFASVPPPLDVEVVIIAIFGGAVLKVRPRQVLKFSGFSLFGGRSVEPMRQLPTAEGAPAASPPDDDDDLDLDEPLDVTTYAVFGGVQVKREDGTIPLIST